MGEMSVFGKEKFSLDHLRGSFSSNVITRSGAYKEANCCGIGSRRKAFIMSNNGFFFFGFETSFSEREGEIPRETSCRGFLVEGDREKNFITSIKFLRQP